MDACLHCCGITVRQSIIAKLLAGVQATGDATPNKMSLVAFSTQPPPKILSNYESTMEMNLLGLHTQDPTNSVTEFTNGYQPSNLRAFGETCYFQATLEHL